MSRQQEEDRLAWEAQAAAGAAVRKIPAQSDPWTLALAWSGREVRIGFTGYRNLSAVELGAPLGQRPISLLVASKAIRLSGLPAVITGDPEFDSLYNVVGSPPEVVLAGLTPQCRRWLIDTFGGEEPSLKTRGDWLVQYVPLRQSGSRLVLHGCDAIAGPEAFARWMHPTVLLADELCRAFDQRLEQLSSVGGAPSAQGWLAQARAYKRGSVSGYHPRAVLILSLTLLLVLGLVVSGLLAWWLR